MTVRIAKKNRAGVAKFLIFKNGSIDENLRLPKKRHQDQNQNCAVRKRLNNATSLSPKETPKKTNI